ncbi:MAG: HPF/RaiA family ribosome-associated protein, partial [Candidatus Peregrinibacteria bacterium]
MDVRHFEKGIHLSDDQRLQMARKIGKTATYCTRIKDDGSVIRIECERRPTRKDRDQVKVTVTVKLPRVPLMRATSRRPDPVEAVDRCIDKLKPQLKRFKEVKTRRGRMISGRKQMLGEGE